jgi:hypothetical protein
MAQVQIDEAKRKEFRHYMLKSGLTFKATAERMKCNTGNLFRIIREGKTCSEMTEYKLNEMLEKMKRETE